MSAETYADVEAAVRAHMADENDGAYLTAFHLVAAGADVSDPQSTHYSYCTSDSAPHEWLGLLGMAQRRALRWEAGDGT